MMYSMFKDCVSLTSINISNFDTKNVEAMNDMFSGCESLKILDFSNIDISKVTNMNNMFLNCKNLEYINIKNYKSNTILDYNKFFKNVKDNLVICVRDENLKSLINDYSCHIVNCLNNLYEAKQKIDNNCSYYCSYYHYFENSKTMFTCTKSYSCPSYYDKLIENKKECTSNCTNDDIYQYEFKKKCYSNCPNNTKERENIIISDGIFLYNKYFCEPICNESSPFEIIPLQECVSYCSIEDILKNICVFNYYSTEKDYELKAHNIMLNNSENGFISFDYNTSNLEEGNNEIIKFRKMIITLSTTKSQKENKNKNGTTIDFTNCETELRKRYNISKDDLMFIKMVEVIEEGMKIPKIEYDVYSKLNNTNLEKLNLSYCKKLKIDIFIPVNLTEDKDKHNSSSDYYNNFCYTTTSDYGTDIILNDRKNEFIQKNRTVCQENCIFSDYDENNKRAKCSCEVKLSSLSFDNIKIDKEKLKDNFLNIKNIANIQILPCYKILFSKKGIIKNIGNYILIPILTL